jgi:hypothetical protein
MLSWIDRFKTSKQTRITELKRPNSPSKSRSTSTKGKNKNKDKEKTKHSTKTEMIVHTPIDNNLEEKRLHINNIKGFCVECARATFTTAQCLCNSHPDRDNLLCFYNCGSHTETKCDLANCLCYNVTSNIQKSALENLSKQPIGVRDANRLCQLCTFPCGIVGCIVKTTCGCVCDVCVRNFC